jgi:hypothetical protein
MVAEIRARRGARREKMFTALLSLCVGLLLAGTASAQDNAGAQEVLTDEIIRRGDMVEHVGGDEIQSEVALAIMQVTDGPPPRDIDKWFIYAVGIKGCKACQELAEEWKTNTILRAYAKPESPRESWAHFTYLRYDDPLQSWRWKKSEKNPNPPVITAFPTIICQPPRNGAWVASDIVYQGVYQGDPKKFSQELNRAIKLYVSTVTRENAAKRRRVGPPEVREPHRESSDTSAIADLPPGGIGQQVFPPPDIILPNDEPEPVKPKPHGPLDRIIERRGAEIVIVRDPEEVYGTIDEAAIQAAVDELQPVSGKPLRIKEIDLKKGAELYGVDPFEVPVVLKVEGEDVREKRKPNVEKEKGFVFVALTMLGLYAAYKSFGGIVGAVFSLLMIAAFLIVLLLFLPFIVRLFRKLADSLKAAWNDGGTTPSTPTAPAPTPAPADEAARLRAELEVAKLRAELAATKESVA